MECQIPEQKTCDIGFAGVHGMNGGESLAIEWAVPSKVVLGKFGSTFRFELELDRTEREVQVRGSENF
jgi:hypothetical protein